MKNIYLRILLFILTISVFFLIIYRINIQKNEKITITSIIVFLSIIIFFFNHNTVDKFTNKLDDYSSHDALFAKNKSPIQSSSKAKDTPINFEKNLDEDSEKNVDEEYEINLDDSEKNVDRSSSKMLLENDLVSEKKREVINFYNYLKSLNDPELYDKVLEIAIMKRNQYLDLLNQSKESKQPDCKSPEFSSNFEQILDNIPKNENSKNNNDNSQNPMNINVNFNNNLLRAISSRSVNDYLMDKAF